MTPSHYQQKIVEFVREQYLLRRAGKPHRNLVVQATAGSGKSTQLRLLCEALQPLGARVDVVAFNSRVARDASARLPSCARSLTLHAAGKRAWEALCGRRFVEAQKADRDRGDGELASNKTDRIVARLKGEGRIDRYVPAGQVRKLVSRAKGCGLVPLARVSGAVAYDDLNAPDHYECVRAGVASPVDLQPMVQDSDDAWRQLIAEAELQTSAPGPLIAAARAVLAVSVQSSQAIIDFDDMVYLPAVCPTVTFEHRDAVMVDELQDLDPMQRAMVVKMCGRCPRCAGDDVPVDGWRSDDVCRKCGGARDTAVFVGVGDRRQSLYHFRGADSESMDKCAEVLDCAELPLSICYRCPTSHVALAAEVAPEIEAAPGAEEGEVVDYDAGVPYLEGKRLLGDIVDCCPVHSVQETPDEATCLCDGAETRHFPRSSDFQPGDAVICRLNAPLVQMTYALMRARVPFRLLGRDFGRGLSALVEATRMTTAEAALTALKNRLRRLEADDAKARAAGHLDDGPSEVTSALRERVEVLEAVSEMLDGDCPSAADLCREIESLFSEEGDGCSCVTLSSIHRAKGAEWDRVWVLDRDLMRSKPGASSQRAVEQANCVFVSLTRARRSLFFISSKHMP